MKTTYNQGYIKQHFLFENRSWVDFSARNVEERRTKEHEDPRTGGQVDRRTGGQTRNEDRGQRLAMSRMSWKTSVTANTILQKFYEFVTNYFPKTSFGT